MSRSNQIIMLMKPQKTFILSLTAAFLCLASSCNDWLTPPGQGEMTFSFSPDVRSMITKSSAGAIPDTNNFILKVSDASGKPLYEGLYSSVPDPMSLDPGSYTVRAVSNAFNKPDFSIPQFGDEQLVLIRAGERTDVSLNCVRMNAGIRLKIASSFMENCPRAVLFLKNAAGKLMYSYSETRFAYFAPGNVSLMMSEDGVDKVLDTRPMAAGDMLTLNVSAAAKTAAGKGISIGVDTTGNWMTDHYVIGGSDNGGASGTTLGVNEARNAAGKTGVWVTGYIVGGDMSSSKIKFSGPFSSQTHIAIAGRASCTDRDMCMSVQLNKGEIRDRLNLASNPSNLGRKIYVKGDIAASYYGIPGIQNITEYRIE